MTESTPPQRQDDEDTTDTTDTRDVSHAEGGRTRGETDVDDALGSGER
jgi:hypothetical protein